MRQFGLEILATDKLARSGILTTPHGDVETPFFMPVGTRGMVRLTPPWVVAEAGFRVLLSNTYHLMLRPGADVVEKVGGLHRFAGWEGAMLTDSGGFQVMSLDAKFEESGVTFKSVYDGSFHKLTPELAIQVQEALGADIAMVLDVCTMLPNDKEKLARALDLTIDWARRAKDAKLRADQALFGIVQGGTEIDLRIASAEATVGIGFDGYAIGGLAVGEDRDTTVGIVELVTKNLPEQSPRYLMGVGDPYTIVESVARGVDMFDCVSPTRLARHGTALVMEGKVHVRRRENLYLDSPIEQDCPCPTCQRLPRSLISHLLRVDPWSAGSALAIHNLWFMSRLMSRIRASISSESLDDLRAEMKSIWRNA